MGSPPPRGLGWLVGLDAGVITEDFTAPGGRFWHRGAFWASAHLKAPDCQNHARYRRQPSAICTQTLRHAATFRLVHANTPRSPSSRRSLGHLTRERRGTRPNGRAGGVSERLSTRPRSEVD